MLNDLGFSPALIAELDLNVGALLFMVGILIMALRTQSLKDIRSNLLVNLIIQAIATAVCCVLLAFLVLPRFNHLRILTDIVGLVLELAISLQLIIIFFYVLYEIFKSKDYVKRQLKKYRILVIIQLVIPFINLPTGWFWYFDENNYIQYPVIYDVYSILRYAFLIGSIVMYIRFKSREKNAQRFNIWLLVIPMIIGTIAENVTGYGVWILGACVGYTNLYILVSNEMGYRDHETGFFNIHYLKHLYGLVDKGTYELSSIITYKLKDTDKAEQFADAIRSVLPDECDTIRTDKASFVTVSESSDKGYVFMLSEDVAMMAEEAGLEVSVDSITRSKKEIPADFFIDNIRLKR